MKNTGITNINYWYKDVIIYQTHVKSFYDSNNDGIGDFPGLTKKLDYLENLGFGAIWILPFYESPLKDDGYDIADYYKIHPDFGNLSEFKTFIREAHKRDIKVITELVINHTSDQHIWFQQARKAPRNSAKRNYYMWSETQEKYQDARIIFKDFETSNWAWDPVAKAYYWHRFYSHQPDLNFDNPKVHKEIFKIADFWFKLGVDGLRLDAVPYLYAREGTNCENLPETHEYLKELRNYIDSHYPEKMLLAEANQWPEETVSYFGEEDECNMAFNFPLMPRIFISLQTGDSFPIRDILNQTPEIPYSCQWALFLRNHDELTLEMVTDEERDYMYRVFAGDPKARINLGIRRRLAPLLNNDRSKIELMNSILFSLPGTPVIYYGDEIGMGDNYYLGDRNGVRTPMQWSPTKNAGFSDADPQGLYLPIIIAPEYHYEAVNVENQEKNPSSLLSWMKMLISTRKKFKAFSRGSLKFIQSDNPKIISFIRKYEKETILVVVNLSIYCQSVELKLSEYEGYYPQEVIGNNFFPVIGKDKYTLTLGSYTFYWLNLKISKDNKNGNSILKIKAKASWSLLNDKEKENIIKKVLNDYIEQCSWFVEKQKSLKNVEVAENILLIENPLVSLFFLKVNYSDDSPEFYLLPVASIKKQKNENFLKEIENEAVICTLNEDEFIYDAFYDKEIRNHIFRVLFLKNVYKGHKGRLLFTSENKLKNYIKHKNFIDSDIFITQNMKNTLINYNNSFFMKIYRHIEYGVHPGKEVLKFLERKHFPNISPLIGDLTYHSRMGGNMLIGTIQKFSVSKSTVLEMFQNQARTFYKFIVNHKNPGQILEKINNEPNINRIEEFISKDFSILLKQLARVTAEMHIKLSDTEDKAFKTEPFSKLYQYSIYQSVRSNVLQTFRKLELISPILSEIDQNTIKLILEKENLFLQYLRKITLTRINCLKIRIHGDYKLSRILYTDEKLIITGFEGDSNHSISERKLKHSVLKDIATILISFYISSYEVFNEFSNKDLEISKNILKSWYILTEKIFIETYKHELHDTNLIPKKENHFELLINILLIKKISGLLKFSFDKKSSLNIVFLQCFLFILENKCNTNEV